MHMTEPEICPTFDGRKRIERVRFISTAATLTLCSLMSIALVIEVEIWLLVG
jgi:hypothetical protein